MRALGIVVAMTAVIAVGGYIAGWFNPSVEVNVNPEVSKKVETFTHDTLESAQGHTNRAFETLKGKVQKEARE